MSNEGDFFPVETMRIINALKHKTEKGGKNYESQN